MANERSARDKGVFRTSLTGILTNLALVVGKGIVGFISGSIAVVLDALNNLSDAVSSVVTMIGNFLAGRKPDKKHPLGHGRVEYISALIVAALVLYAGITAGVESVKSIFSAESNSYYSPVSLIIIGVAVLVKVFLGLYFKRNGKKYNSTALIASGTDALFDAILSSSVLASAIIFVLTGVNLESYVGVVISLFIIKSGISLLLDTFNDIVGRRADREMVREIKETVCEEPEVFGAYDLILHSYGPDKFLGSIHIEIPDYLTAAEIDGLERRIAEKVFEKHGVIMTGIGIYSRNETSDESATLRSKIMRKLAAREYVLQVHGFHLDTKTKTVNLDLILDFDAPDMHAEFDKIREELQAEFPEYTFRLILDLDI